MTNLSLEEQILRLGEKHNIEQLKKLVKKSSTNDLTKVLMERLSRKDGCALWNYLLQSFDANDFESLEKRFSCVKCFLDCLFKIELSYKQAYDLTTRLCQDLSTFTSEQLVHILENCIDGMRAGDPKCISWKDLLPETLTVLSNMPQINVNGITTNGREFRDATIRNLCSMRWPNEVLTAIADMFKEMHLDSNYIILLLNKFSNSLQNLSPSELPALAFQLFSICNTAAQIVIPILGLEKYFYRYYYKKLFADMNSNSTDFESIDAFSDRELREAEETVLHHLNYCTQYKISELQMGAVLKNFSTLPDVILTPFSLSAVLTMTLANRESDVRLSTSVLLHFLRNVIKNNEDERNLSEYSVWCRDSLQKKQVNLEEVFTVLIDQNKDGKDVITPGLVNLIFVLLKVKHNTALNNLAIAFLTKFIRKRFVFGQGIVKKLAEWMIVEQDSPQYSECLTLLSMADTFTVSECIKTITYIMDFFIWIPGDQAMRMMSFILPILKISPIVRDSLIEVLRKALNSRDVKTNKMAVYGFCMILKQLNNSNSQRSQLGASGFCTQHSISGFSLMSQATLGSRSNPQRHFDMLTLEIIGLLRNCFVTSLDIKLTLYEQLQRAVELNPKLVPHLLQFIDWHFRSYFDIPDETDDDIKIRLDKTIHTINESEDAYEVTDNIGKLILFITHCLVIYEKLEKNYDVRALKKVIDLSVEKMTIKELNFNEHRMMQCNYQKSYMVQQIRLIEGLMAYTLLTSTQKNDNPKKLLFLFKAYQKCCENLSSIDGAKNSQKKSKIGNDAKDTSNNLNFTGKASKKFNLVPDNIWDLDVIDKFLRLLHENVVPFAAPNNITNSLRGNVELVRYVLETATLKVEIIRAEPDYKQLAHSRRTLKYLTDITKVVYERCIRRLVDLFKDFDAKTATLAAVCFKECLHTANTIYKKKFIDVFAKGFDLYLAHNGKEAATVVQEVIDAYMTNDDLSQSDNNEKNTVISILLQCLEILYENATYSSRITFDSYTWLLHFCKTYEVHSKEVSFVFKLLFVQRQKTHSGAFFNAIASDLGRILGKINESKGEELDDAHGKHHIIFKSITLISVDSCLQHLFAIVRKQIENVEYFIVKANNSHYKCRIVPEDDRDICFGNLRSLERSICSQLVHTSNTLVELTNVCIPLGNLMDNLLKLVIQHYICVKNLARHFINCFNSQQLSIQSTKYDSLLQVVGKPLPTNIYALITYIEANILEVERKKKSDPLAEKSKVLRETKLIPKLILAIENFNKHVIVLAKKSNERLANFLHFGTVRDFRIKTSDLKAALVKTLSRSSEIDANSIDLNENTISIDDGVDDHNDEAEDDLDAETDSSIKNLNNETDMEQNILSTRPSSKKANSMKMKKQKNKIVSDEEEGIDEPTPEDGVLENESHKESATQLLENIAKINKRAKKRSLRDLDKKQSDVMSGPPPESKKRRCRERET